MDSWIEYFNFELLIIDNIEYKITPSEIIEFKSPSNYWNGEGDPSTWLMEKIFNFVKKKYVNEPKSVQKKIASHLLNITEDRLSSSLDWNKQYIKWHDGYYS
jgi:hypothetical protein